MTTGEKIRAARKAAGLTQTELANKLGISPQNIVKWETKVRNAKPSTLQRLADALDIDVHELVGGIVLPPRVEDITPQLAVDVLTRWARDCLADAKATDLLTATAYNTKCAIALVNAAEIIRLIFPECFNEEGETDARP